MSRGAGRDGAGALSSLLGEHRGCRRCVDAGLLTAARPVVAGAAGQRVVLVGQAPGPVEHAAGRPWSGRAGRQLMRWMEAAGLGGEEEVRRRVFMTSATSCFPGRRPGGAGDRRPTARELELCAPWLDAYLALLRPRLVVAVGSLAVERLIGPRPLGGLVGRVLGPGGAELGAGLAGAGGAAPGVPARDLPLPLILVLPHPSGQSRWLNQPERRRLLDAALRRLGELVRWAGTA